MILLLMKILQLDLRVSVFQLIRDQIYYPHLGYVYIGNNCSIGSNCTIDRGKLDVTLIDDYCMLDNLIHVAHNVSIKKNSI